VRPDDIVERVRNSDDRFSCSSLAGPSSAASSVTTEGAESSTARGGCASLVAEGAAYVVVHGSISLDTKLGIFTVRGTVKPRLVQ